LAAVPDGDWRRLKGEDRTAQLRYIHEMLRMFAEQSIEAPVADNAPANGSLRSHAYFESV